jgi:hypothetical protein
MAESIMNKVGVSIAGVATMLLGAKYFANNYDIAQDLRHHETGFVANTSDFVGDLPHIGNRMFVDVPLTTKPWEKAAQEALPFGALSVVGAGVTVSPVALNALRRKRKG